MWQTTASAGYLYFSIPASLNAVAGQPLYVAVQYYDTGYNRLGYQYDSTQGAFFPAEVTAHSSLVNSNTFATSYFAMETPTLQKQENGGNDFRIYGTNGPVSIASVSIQTTPFNNATFQLALTTPWLTTYPTSTADASTLKGKTFAGYQGWFACPNDLSDQGWTHWSVTSPFTVQAGFPTWPNVPSYRMNSQYAGATCKADNQLTQSGNQAYVYSSANPDVIGQHFSWMQQNNIDGVWVQRFLGSGSVPGANPEWVLAGVRKSAPQYQRLWAIEYDVSELSGSNVVQIVEADWKWLHHKAQILNDGNYMHNAGKPVIIVWGLECRKDLGFTAAEANSLIAFCRTTPPTEAITSWAELQPIRQRHSRLDRPHQDVQRPVGVAAAKQCARSLDLHILGDRLVSRRMGRPPSGRPGVLDQHL